MCTQDPFYVETNASENLSFWVHSPNSTQHCLRAVYIAQICNVSTSVAQHLENRQVAEFLMIAFWKLHPLIPPPKTVGLQSHKLRDAIIGCWRRQNPFHMRVATMQELPKNCCHQQIQRDETGPDHSFFLLEHVVTETFHNVSECNLGIWPLFHCVGRHAVSDCEVIVELRQPGQLALDRPLFWSKLWIELFGSNLTPTRLNKQTVSIVRTSVKLSPDGCPKKELSSDM